MIVVQVPDAISKKLSVVEQQAPNSLRWKLVSQVSHKFVWLSILAQLSYRSSVSTHILPVNDLPVAHFKQIPLFKSYYKHEAFILVSLSESPAIDKSSDNVPQAPSALIKDESSQQSFLSAGTM